LGKSFVLKNREGKAVGYIQQREQGTRCMARTAEESAQIWLCFENGTSRLCAYETAGEEVQWAVNGETLRGACLLENGICMADTGEAVRRAYANYIMERKQAESKPPVQMQNPPAERKKEHPAVRRLPVRRWPPNPCAPEAGNGAL